MERVEVAFGMPRWLRRQVSEVLGWLEQFEGNTWEQRWLASGADAAPTPWRQAVRPNGNGVGVGARMKALMVARLLRPSYVWQLTTRARFHLSSRMLEVNDAEALGRLRALPVYQRALLRHQFDAVACLSRVMIRTGRVLEQLQGDDLLHYADVVKTSGRTRREHLAWELMVALGPLASEPSTLRAAWSAKGNTRQHSVATLVDRYGIGAGGVRDLLVDYITEIKPSMDYGTLEGWVYRLVRLFGGKCCRSTRTRRICGSTPQQRPPGESGWRLLRMGSSAARSTPFVRGRSDVSRPGGVVS